MTSDEDLSVSSNVTLWFASAFLHDGWAHDVRLTLGGGVIRTVETGVSAQGGDVRGAIALPGLCNVHSHGFQRGMAGLTEAQGDSADDFWTWRETMYRFLDRGGPDEIEAITAMAYMEMLESGFTRVGEFHYLHNDQDGRAFADPAEMAGRIASAADETGIGLTLLPVFYAHSDFGGAAPLPGQRRFVTSLDGFARLVESSRAITKSLAGAVVGIAPHSLRAVTPEELQAILPLAGDGPVHIHAAEQVREVEACLAWSGARPVEWLLANAAVDQRWCLVHATHLTPPEVAGLVASDATAGLCPITEANLGDGVFPAQAFLRAGGRFGVGSDSNVQIGAADELRLLEYSQRLALRGRNILAAGRSTGTDLFAGALTGGAAATGVDGGLKVGAPADILGLDGEHPAIIGREHNAVLDSWIFSCAHGLITDVWRAGEKVVSEGRHLRRNQIVRRYRSALETILA